MTMHLRSRTTPARRAAARRLLALLVVTLSALAVAACGSSSDSDVKATSNSVLSVGPKWKVTVSQNNSVAAPTDATGTAGQTYDSVYRFKVKSAPTKKVPYWQVHATLEGAAGPLADGFTLWYAQNKDGSVTLKQVALGTGAPTDAAAASAVLGQAFPLDRQITKPPTDRTQKAPGNGAGTDTTELPPTLPEPAN